MSPDSRTLLALAFKALMWLNGLGIALVFIVALGLIPWTLSPYWLRLPLALYLAGVLLAVLGLFWSGMLHTALSRQCLSGNTRRSHWIPALLTLISYFLAFLAFAAACWAFLGVMSLAHYHDDVHRGMRQGSDLGFYSPKPDFQNWHDEHSTLKYTHCA